MFRRKGARANIQDPTDSSNTEEPEVKYPHPKILLIDLSHEVETLLRSEGYTVVTGTFGVPYKVEKADNFCPVIPNGRLPSNYAEQEIVVVDLVPRDPLEQLEGEKVTSPGENDWWASCSRGVIDPRPRLMVHVQNDLDEILSHGGALVVFASERFSQKTVLAHTRSYEGLIVSEDIRYDNWSFLSTLSDLIVSSEYGEEISVLDEESLVGRVLSKHISGARFLCTVEPVSWAKRVWLALATNKYGKAVAGAFADEKGKGIVCIFPQVRDKARFLSALLGSVLPNILPQLFPHVEGLRWVFRTEYELPSVLEFQARIQRIQEEAKEQVGVLERTIEEERDRWDFLYDLLRATDRTLVIAVKRTLETLGFKFVVDVDAQIEEQAIRGPKREDLQVHDRSPILLVEVKGITGLPSDAEALQATNYLAPRMKEWKRVDVQALAIINHQRNVPAMDRENRAPFREDVLTNAQERELGLLTCWDLFRLVRSYLKNGWRHESIRSLFYQAGRIDPVPTHYQFIGVVEHFWEKVGVVGVRIQDAEIRKGDRIAFELPVEFEEQIADSIQVDNSPVMEAGTDTLVGIRTDLAKDELKKGTRVFRLTGIGQAFVRRSTNERR